MKSRSPFESPHTVDCRFGQRAIVVGGSMAGLLAARVLSEHFSEVLIVDRDAVVDDANPRPGVPQSLHLHAMLPRGLQLLNQMFPGISDDLEADGSIPLDIANDIAWLTPKGWGVKFQSGLQGLSFTRDLLDCHVRRRVRRLPNVQLQPRHDVIGFLSGNPGEVIGVRVQQRTPGLRGAVENISADLVVVASGRQNAIPDWFAAIGLRRSQATIINAHIGYATRILRRPSQFIPSWKAIILQAAPPKITRAGLIFPIERDRWMCTLIGGDRDYPPADENGFLEFARSLPSPALHNALRAAEPLTAIRCYRATDNRRYDFSQISNWPKGVVVLGDALCAFNPVYGQGMTTAALEADLLGRLLRHHTGAEQLEATFQKQAARVVNGPWTLATSADLRYRSVEGARASLRTRLVHWYVDEVLRLGTGNQWARKRFLEVQGMLRDASAIFQPDMIGRVLLGLLSRRSFLSGAAKLEKFSEIKV